MVQYNNYGIIKAKKVINKALRERGLTPGQRITIDFHNFTKGYKGSIRLLLITNRLTIII